jgi:trimeric autotransporter adhesin
LSISGTSLTLTKGGGTVTLPSSGGGDNWGTQTAVTNSTLEGNGTTATPLKIAQQAATTGQALKWNGTNWAPGTDIASGSIAGGDLGGTYPNPTVAKIQGIGVSNTTPSSGQVLKYNGISWGPSTISTGLTLPFRDSSSFAVTPFSIENTGSSYFTIAGSGNTGYGIYGSTKGTNTAGVLGMETGTSYSMGVLGMTGEGNSTGIPGNTGVLGLSAANIGVAGTSLSGTGGYFSSNSGTALRTIGSLRMTGIGEAAGRVLTSDATGVATWKDAAVNGLTLPYSQSISSGGYALSITNTLSNGIKGLASATSGKTYGVTGQSDSNQGIGVYGFNSSSTGYNYGVYGVTTSTDGVGVAGHNTSETGYTVGVHGTSTSPVGYGVLGQAPVYGVYGSADATNGVTYGIYGNSHANFGYGVYGTSSFCGIKGEAGSYGVVGTANADDGIGIFGINGGSTGFAGYFWGRLTVSGNTGIGTTNPSYLLDVAGPLNLNKDLYGGGALYCNGSETIWYNGSYFSWGYGGTWNYFGDKIFIGAVAADPGANMLVVNGAAAKPGGGSWATWSDSRLKDIQGNYEKGLKEIIELKPVKFNYKAGNACNLPSDQNYVGFVAQDVQKVFPEAVSEGKDGYLSLDVNSINVALVNAIKDLKAENDQLKERLTKLEKLMEANGIK